MRIRGGPTLTLFFVFFFSFFFFFFFWFSFFILVDGGREDPNISTSGPSSANGVSLACR